ncbi:MAG: hypothetical protein GX493_04260 [Firmicutes bacterium]|nr:hypothetical protein [Bacillota bacterium]
MEFFPTFFAVLVYLLSLFGLGPKNAEPRATAPFQGSGFVDPSPSSIGEIMAFYAERYRNDPAPRRSLGNATGLTTVLIFGPALKATGELYGSLDRTTIAQARGRHLKVLATIHNAGSGRFDRGTVHAFLQNPAARTRAIEEIQKLLSTYGLDGVCLDLENVPPEDREALTAFFRDLSSRLRPRYFLVAACLPAKTGDDSKTAWMGAYDFAALGPYLDLAVLMAYDEHRPDGPPGPVASLGWVEKVVRYAVTTLPRQKIVLGLPAYGYVWGPKNGRAITHAGALSLLAQHGLRSLWDATAQVPYFRYTQAGTTYAVWYEDKRSGMAKAALARRYGLRGVAVWRLGYEDPELWKTLEFPE